MINKEFNVIIMLKETDLRYLIKQNLHEGASLEFIKCLSDLAQKEHSIKMTIDQAEADLDACIVKPISY